MRKKRHHGGVISRSMIDSTTADMHMWVRRVRVKSDVGIHSGESNIWDNIDRQVGLVEDGRAWVCGSETIQIEMPVESAFIARGEGVIGLVESTGVIEAPFDQA